MTFFYVLLFTSSDCYVIVIEFGIDYRKITYARFTYVIFSPNTIKLNLCSRPVTQ